MRADEQTLGVVHVAEQLADAPLAGLIPHGRLFRGNTAQELVGVFALVGEVSQTCPAGTRSMYLK